MGFIKGGGGYWEAITDGIMALLSAQQLLEITHSGAITTIKGADATGDDLKIFANSTDALPYIQLYGNGNVDLHTVYGGNIRCYNNTVPFVQFISQSDDFNIAIKETSDSPTNIAGYAQLYTKADNHLYYKDGDGTEYTLNKT